MPDVYAFLGERKKEPDAKIASEWTTLEELYQKKLWHQVTLHLVDFVKEPYMALEKRNVHLYEQFLRDFENKINPLTLVEIVSYVVPQLDTPADAVKFLAGMEEKVKVSKEAVALCKVLQGNIQLSQLENQEESKKLIDDTEKILDEIDGLTSVHDRFYLLASDLYRVQAKHADYYRAALRFLGCTDMAKLATSDQQVHAYRLGLAALLGEGVYNFGELLAHPVLESLKGGEHSWLIDLLFAFNAGELERFEALRPRWTQVEDLRTAEITLRQKISLLCLMEMTFKRPATDRMLSFEEIAQYTRLDVNEVELLVMRALAQGLLKGSIDQVAGKVHATWVQPRVLDKQQISSMIQRLDVWCRDIQSMEILLENKGSEILTL